MTDHTDGHPQPQAKWPFLDFLLWIGIMVVRIAKGKPPISAI